MTFLNPALLWGLLAVAVPIALHFWHQQRAKPMPWAMLRWLETPNQPPKRGFRFDNWLLLALRCLVLIALTLLLARPFFSEKNTSNTTGAVHLVEPNEQVVATYRFELEQAKQRNEPLFWATELLQPLTDLTETPRNQPLNPLTLQAAITDAETPSARLHLYIRNTPDWVDAVPMQVPGRFMLHPVEVLSTQKTDAFVALAAGRQLSVNESGRLAVSGAANGVTKPIASAPLRVLIQCKQAAERSTVRAALEALTVVYGVTYLIDEQPVKQAKYNWILTDQPVSQPDPGTLYTVTNVPSRPDWPNICYLPGPLTPQGSDWVANGQLPERLGNQLIHFLRLTPASPPLNNRAFAALFKPENVLPSDALPTTHTRNALQNGLLVLFLSLLLAERWLATKREG